MKSLLWWIVTKITFERVLKTAGLACFVVMCPIFNLWTANILFGFAYPITIETWGAAFWLQVGVLILATYLRPQVTVNTSPIDKVHADTRQRPF